METAWRLVAFPVILPWRSEFWTLPLYFPHLAVGVLPGWPPGLPYQGMPLPPQAEAGARDLKHYAPGELSQWQAYREFQRSQEEVDDLIKALRGEPPAAPPQPGPSPEAWTLAWQLEKLQADQDAQMSLVDQGQGWLADILMPEPWVDAVDFGPVAGAMEIVDPELARLRYRLWQRVMAPHHTERWAPFLLGPTSQAIFAALRGGPEWRPRLRVTLSLPGCRSEAEWRQVRGEGEPPAWLPQFTGLLTSCLTAAAGPQGLEEAVQELQQWVDDTLTRQWPPDLAWRWPLEIWTRDPEAQPDWGPVLCGVSRRGETMPG